MKRTMVFLMCSVALSLTGFVGAASEPGATRPEPLFPAHQRDKCGYIDRTGKVVIEPRFNYGRRFSDGFAAVQMKRESDNKWVWGFIDRTGAFVIAPRFEEAGDFSESLAMVKDAQCGFVNRAGLMVIPPRFSRAESFSEGLAVVEIGDGNEKRWGYVDQSGNPVIAAQFQEAASFHQGLAAVKQGGKYGCIDKTGAFVIPATYALARDFSEDLAFVIMEGADDPPKAAYLDRSGKTVVELRAYEAGDFREGLAPVNVKFEFGVGKSNVPIVRGSWGYIDTTGKRVIDFQYAEAHAFHDGLAAVNVGSVFQAKWGFIDRTGKMVIKPQFSSIGDFADGLAEVYVGSRTKSQRAGEADFAVMIDLGVPGYIDVTGKVIWKPQTP